MTEEREAYINLDEESLFKRQQPTRARSAYWLTCWHLGRLIVLGPYTDQVEADRENYSKLEGKGEVVELNTIDRSRATAMLKKKLLDKGRDLDKALQRAKHQV